MEGAHRKLGNASEEVLLSGRDKKHSEQETVVSIRLIPKEPEVGCGLPSKSAPCELLGGLPGQ